MPRIDIIRAFTASAVIAGTAVATTPPTVSDTPASVMVFDQTPKDDSIGVTYVYLPEDGYAAVYRSDKNGRPTGKAIGYTKLPAGDHRDIKIELKGGPKFGETLWISLYKDADNSADFKPGSGDQAYWSPQDKPWDNHLKVR